MLDKIILWGFLILGIALFIVSFRKQPIKDSLMTFFITGYFAHVLGTFVVEFEYVKYPVTFLEDFFPSSILFEIALFPVINIYFYQTSYRSRLFNTLWQCFLYSSGLTIIELMLEKYTNLITYTNWNWFITFVTVFFFMLGTRYLLKLINYVSR